MGNSKDVIINFDEVSHIYTVNGVEYPSVTQLLPQREFFLSPAKLQELAEEGTANHAAVKEFLDSGVSPCGYTDGVKNFLDKFRQVIGEVVQSETPLFSESEQFCGTPDIVCERAIIDIKRSYYNAKYHSLQLVGYNILARENKVIGDKCRLWYILIPRDDGNFNVWNVYSAQAEGIFKSLILKHRFEKYALDIEHKVNNFLRS